MHDNGKLIGRYLEMPHETLTHIGGSQRAFEVVRNSVMGFVYCVGSKVCVISVYRPTVIAQSWRRDAAINYRWTIAFHDLYSYVSTGVVHQIASRCRSETRISNNRAVLRRNNSGDELPGTNQLTLQVRTTPLHRRVAIPFVGRGTKSQLIL
jgi:hypothetical protein